MARHAAVDLALVFRVPPLPPQPNRLEAEPFARLRDLLRRANIDLGETEAFEKRLAELRKLYEPFVNALARHFLLALPPILADNPKADNWQTSALDAARSRHWRPAHRRRRRALRLNKPQKSRARPCLGQDGLL